LPGEFDPHLAPPGLLANPATPARLALIGALAGPGEDLLLPIPALRFTCLLTLYSTGRNRRSTLPEVTQGRRSSGTSLPPGRRDVPLERLGVGCGGQSP